MSPVPVSPHMSHAGRKKKQKQETLGEADARGQGCGKAGYIDVGGPKGERPLQPGFRMQKSNVSWQVMGLKYGTTDNQS